MRVVKLGLRKEGSVLFNESSIDIMSLCGGCHQTWHGLFGKMYINKHHVHKIRNLIKLGVIKKIAFQIAVDQKELYPYIYQHLKDRSIEKGTYNKVLFSKFNSI